MNSMLMTMAADEGKDSCMKMIRTFLLRGFGGDSWSAGTTKMKERG